MERSGEYTYVVTLKNMSDLDDFYTEMESSNGTGNIPNRTVQCILKRPISRSTHYQLTDEEASKLKNDDRVLDVEEPYYNRGIVFKDMWDQPQTSSWDKEPEATANPVDRNWALKRCTDGQQTSNWGEAPGNPTAATGSVNTTSSGKNVDIVIVDRHIDHTHSEFSDGNGGSRVNLFNWYQYSGALGYETPANYTYNLTGGSHGTHVAGIAVGNTNGWARDANIYNISWYIDDVAGNATDYPDMANWSTMFFDYIRYWHEDKSINPTTGRKNPTIVNCSFGSVYPYKNWWLNNGSTDYVNLIQYRGYNNFVNGTSVQKKEYLEDRRLPVTGHDSVKGWYIPDLPARTTELDSDIELLISSGMIVVGGAGNESFSLDVESGSDYNNGIQGKYNSNGIALRTSRGSSPASTKDVICVGSVGVKVDEYKSYFSNFEERVDVWAPGSNIISSANNNAWATASGTSVACPQVSGLLGCLAEQWPNMKQADALQFLKETSRSQVGNNLPVGNSVTESPYEAFGDGNNRYVRYVYKRPQTGTVYPHDNHANRNENTSGVKYPRVRYTVTK